MQIIADLENLQRNVYAGIRLFWVRGNHDSCIAIRTVMLTGGNIHLQAGAGIVADSVPENEYQETINKAKGMLKAIALAKLFPTQIVQAIELMQQAPEQSSLDIYMRQISSIPRCVEDEIQLKKLNMVTKRLMIP